MTKQIMDGCTAATYVAYAWSDVATIYPITPIASMGEMAQKWAFEGRKNLFGQPMQVEELESELGAAGATHGALAVGALATTFTSSQGLLLMIPNMYKIAGELLPGVFHVGCRSVATHALSIFGDHSDIMATRASGFAYLASASVQETMDLGIVAHIAAIEGSVPVVHFFDGWRTSNEMQTIEVVPYSDMLPLVDTAAVERQRARGLNPDNPELRGSAQNPDVFFQNAEAANSHYLALPAIVQSAMDRVSQLTGRSYHLFDYVGAPDAEAVIVVMASGSEVVAETVGYLTAQGMKVGVVKVRLFRPFSEEHLLQAIPATARVVAVLDRYREQGAHGEQLFKDVSTALMQAGRQCRVIGGRYGLASKEFDPSMVKAVFDEALSAEPRREFTVGIDDDVTHLSLNVTDHIVTTPEGMVQCIFYGMGSDGTVGATKQVASIIGNSTDLYAQAYFQYSAKKSGGYTVSQLRFGPRHITSEYLIEEADYVACNKSTYVNRFRLIDNLKQGGIFVLNAPWTTLPQLEAHLPGRLKRLIAAKQAKLYVVDAASVAAANGLGVRINMIMEAVFMKLMPVMPYQQAIKALEDQITQTYMHEGGDVVKRNIAAVAGAEAAITAIDYPAAWATATDRPHIAPLVPEFVSKIARPCLDLEGNALPVSLFNPVGRMPMGTTAYEKRRIALQVPVWDPDKCIQCTECSFVCPHAAIRPYLLTPQEKEAAPAAMETRPAHMPQLKGLEYRIQVFTEDCTGCGSCAVICPGHALTMLPAGQYMDAQIPLTAYATEHITIKDGLLDRFTIAGSQLCQPCLEFSGACAGCGETPYVKLLTQLFGERMIIANATGCSSIWGANYPSNAYCTRYDGRGPAWANSLFEDNAEYGYGMAVGLDRLRALDPKMGPRSVWAIGGDGWAYDIGFAGLDHVLAQNTNINILVMDTECYSNTGGQTSKATPLASTAKYSYDGKRTPKKDLGRMMMSYGHIYVAQVALGAGFQQAITALREAEAYDGPSIVIAYCPCIEHGIRAGMGHSIVEERLAVECGYWQLYRYNPALAAKGKEPLTIDSPAPTQSLVDFINGEDRYADLKMIDPAAAATLQPELSARAHLTDSLNRQDRLAPEAAAAGGAGNQGSLAPEPSDSANKATLTPEAADGAK